MSETVVAIIASVVLGALSTAIKQVISNHHNSDESKDKIEIETSKGNTKTVDLQKFKNLNDSQLRKLIRELDELDVAS